MKKGTDKQQFYEKFAPEWESKINMVETNKRIRVVFDELLDGVELKNKNFLEIGSGLGYFSQIAAEKGAKVKGIDVGKKLIKIASKRVPNGEFKVASAENLPYKNNSFDVVLCTEVIEHMDNPLKAIEEMYRVIKKDGVVVLTTPNKIFHPLFSFLSSINIRPYHGNEKWFYPWELISKIRGAGFTVEKERYFNFIYPNSILDKFETSYLSKYFTINQGYKLAKSEKKVIVTSKEEESEKSHFNSMANLYDKNYGYTDKFTQYKIDKKLNYCKEFINDSASKKKLRILDIGCGTGEYTVKLAKMYPNAEIIGIDISDKIVGVAKKKSRGIKNVKYLAMSAYNTSFKENHFDVVCGFYILHHIDVSMVQSELKRILRKDGIGFFYEPNLLNPVVYLIKNIAWLKEKVGDSPDETAINPLNIKEKLNLFDTELQHTEFIFPTRLIDTQDLINMDRMFDNFRKVPILRLFSGSLLIKIYNRR